MARRAVICFLIGSATTLGSAPLPIQIETKSEVYSRLANLHLSFSEPVAGEVVFTYGGCHTGVPEAAHHVVGRADGITDHAKRLVWIVPDNAHSGGCISAWDSQGSLVGRSEPQTLHKRHQRRRMAKRASIKMTEENGIDPLGPWFEGVNILADKQPGPIDVEEAKSKAIGIVGAGMSGLMSFLVLHQAGMKNISILEGGNRLGGRVHTEYLTGGPFEYSYQEMGPMRFPSTYQDPESGEVMNISDHQLVFQLGEEMNRVNGFDGNLSVDFIPWYQSSPNGFVHQSGFKLPSGLPPTVAQVAANASLGPPVKPLDNSTLELLAKAAAYLPGSNFSVEMAKNMYKAHKDFIVNGLKGLGGDVWSEWAFGVNYLKGSLNDTDVNGASFSSFWYTLHEGLYFRAATWKTIDGGLNRLPLSFHPLVDNITTLNRRIERIDLRPAADKKVLLSYRDYYHHPPSSSSPSSSSEEEENYSRPRSKNLTTTAYDYAIITPPFTIVRKWRLPHTLPTTITNAINKLQYGTACKVALEFSSRFWEEYPDQPIYGGCSTTTDIPGIGQICYPSYNINGSSTGGGGPATLLASYSADYAWGTGWLSATDKEHVDYVLEAMVEIHGEAIRGLYTGKWRRKCWMLDPLASAGWTSPVVGQHQLYIPEYFRTHDGLIFVGEHTSQTHAWIASALESGIRGAVQLLLELGLVDEAKEAVNKWMARWIDI